MLFEKDSFILSCFIIIKSNNNLLRLSDKNGKSVFKKIVSSVNHFRHRMEKAAFSVFVLNQINQSIDVYALFHIHFSSTFDEKLSVKSRTFLFRYYTFNVFLLM